MVNATWRTFLHSRIRIVTLAVIAVLFTAGVASAAELRGRYSADLYAYEDQQGTHWLPYLGLQGNLTLWRGAGRKSIALGSYLRWRSDLGDEPRNLNRLKVYHTYLRLDHLIPTTKINVGRQYVYTTVGGAVLDGVSVYTRPLRSLEIRLFGGSAVSSEKNDRVQSLGDAATLGGRVAYRFSPSISIGGNWLRKKSDNHLIYHRVGLAASYDGRWMSAYGRATFDLEMRSVTDIMARTSFRNPDWYASAEYRTRRASIDVSSIFSLIDGVRSNELRFDLERRLYGRTRAVGQVFVDLLDDDNSWATSLGVSTRMFTLLWHRQAGYGGDSDGIRGRANVPFNRAWSAHASANLSRYRVQAEQVDKSEAYAGGLGIQYRGNGMTLGCEGQFLRNAVDSESFRLFLRFSKYFNTGHRGSETP